jgi:hypothetical protein
MPDEPGGWELHRSVAKLSDDLKDGFSAVNQRLDRLVTTEVHAADLRRVDDRLNELAADISAEREDRRKGEADLQTQIQRLITTIRWVAAAIILPIALFAANIILARQP